MCNGYIYVPVQFDCYIKTHCLRNLFHFLIRAEGIWSTAYLSLRPGFETSCNKDSNRLWITAGITWDVTACRWVSVSRRREWTGCLHLLSSCGQKNDIVYKSLHILSTPSTAIPETYCFLHTLKNTDLILKHDELLSAAFSWFGEGSSQWRGFCVHGYEPLVSTKCG